MELLQNLALGFGIALTPANLFFALAGALIGTLIGVLPGIGPIATIAMLLPLTFHLEPTSGLIMLAGIFYGAQYGGSTTAILVNLPGETSSVVTCIDGHQMARQGRAGAGPGGEEGQRAVADARGLAPRLAGGGAGHGARLGSRRASRRRRDLERVCRLRARETPLAPPGRIRPRRGGGCRRARIRQQCRRADVVHPHADLRHPRQCRHGADDRRAHHSWDPARPADHE